jgi:hypothetical protein
MGAVSLAVARFRREARQAGSVSHPAIASVYGLNRPGARPVYVMIEIFAVRRRAVTIGADHS